MNLILKDEVEINENEKTIIKSKEKQKALNFQSEDLYKDKNKPDDVIKIRGIKKHLMMEKLLS